MSVTSQLSANPDRIFNKSLHRRNDSGELDVFEAAGYFSGYNEISFTGYESSLFTQKVFKEDGGRRGGRMSLDLPIRTNVVPLPPPPYTAEKQTMMKEKKHRQPSSPGGRLASFLNSLFSQSASKKKKKSKNPTAPLRNEDHENPTATAAAGGGRKRRSSLSTLIDSKLSSSIYSSSSSISGFRTPPAPAVNASVQTPTKNYKEIRSYLDQKRPVFKNSFSNLSNSQKGGGNDDHQVEYNKIKKTCEDQKEIMRKMEVVDEGAESDSSSDLFELRIYDLGLPVYETTNIQSIKRASAPISNTGSL